MNIEYVKKTANIAKNAMKERQSPMSVVTHISGVSSSWEYPNLVRVNDGTMIDFYTYSVLNNVVTFQLYDNC